MFHLPKNGRESLKLVSKAALKKRNTIGKTEKRFQIFPLPLEIFHWNFLKSCQVFHLPVLSNYTFVNAKQRNLALHHGGFVPCQWLAAMGQYFIYRGYWTFFIAVPCRCGLRGGYIELVGFNDQLRSRVKTYLSARSCPSTIGQVRIMYVM